VTLSQHGTIARLEVRDYGAGIAAADHTRIFERFERAVPLKRYGGFGLGLWMAREIVVAHGGCIAVTSTPNEGATFTIDLPTVPGPRERSAVRSAAAGNVSGLARDAK
jgi:signal transduction histidine kinase